MDCIPACVILDNSIDSTKFTINDLYKFRFINKSWYDAIKNFKFSENVILSKFETFSTINDVKLLRNSDINLSELERILIQMESVSNREYGEKYGEKFKQNMICKYSSDKITIQNTTKILINVYKYASLLMNDQKKAPTEINKYPILWLSDYFYSLFKNEYPDVECTLKIIDLFDNPIHPRPFFSLNNSTSLFPPQLLMTETINLYEFYKIIIFALNNIIYPFNNFNTKEEEILNNLSLFIHVFGYFDSYYDNDKHKKCIMTQIMDYLYLSLANSEANVLSSSQKIYEVIKNKAEEIYLKTFEKVCPIENQLNFSVNRIITYLIENQRV